MEVEKVETVTAEEIGKVLFVTPRGFGFIETARGVSYFYHINNWVDPYDPPIVGKSVRFKIGPPSQPGKREQAVNVRVVKPLMVEPKVGA
jgi:cold shock CspA family protein